MPTPCCPPRRLITAFVAALLVAVMGLPDSAIAPSTMAVWGWPVSAPHTIVATYQAPATRYAAGHRGIDLRATTDGPVLAPGDGVVTFVGVVVDRPVVAVAHSGDLLSSFEPVIATVSVGDRVVAGEQIGTVAIGGHCLGCVHFGVRLHGEYVSPLLLLGKLPRAVLLPLGP